MIVDAGTFATGTSTGDLAAQTPALGGATPQAGMMFLAGAPVGDASWCIGAWTGLTARASYSAYIEDAATTTDTGHVLVTDAALVFLGSTTAIDGAVDIAAVAANSFTPTIDNAFTGSATVAWWAMAGITAAEAGTFQLTTGADQVVGSSDWDVVIFFGRGTSPGTPATQGHVPVIGFATATKSRCLCGSSQDNVADTNTYGLISDNYSWATINATSGAVVEGILVTSLTGGISLTRVAGTTQYHIGYLALKGVSADIIDSAMVVGTTNQTVTGASFTPKFLMSLLRPPATASEEGTPASPMEGGVGYALGAKHYANWVGEADALASSDPYIAQSTSRMAIDLLISDGTTDGGDMSLVSFDSGGVTLDQDTAAAQATYMPLLLLGDEAVVVPSAALTGTVTSSAVESDIRSGGKTIILTLTDDTWVASGATFNAQRQAIISGIDSAQAEAAGWDAVVKAGLAVGDVVRTSDTVVTITLPAFAGYNITATETITATIPAAALTAAGVIVASPTFTVATIAESQAWGDGAGTRIHRRRMLAGGSL